MSDRIISGLAISFRRAGLSTSSMIPGYDLSIVLYSFVFFIYYMSREGNNAHRNNNIRSIANDLTEDLDVL